MKDVSAMKNLKMTQKKDRELILSDPILCAVLSIEAESVGVTLEEYIDRFLEVYYSDPARLDFLVQ